MKRAYRITARDTSGVRAATSRGAALFRTFAELRDIGYRVRLSDIRVTRAKEYDGWAELDCTGTCWCETALPKNHGG
jgi:hypothetical protein